MRPSLPRIIASTGLLTLLFALLAIQPWRAEVLAAGSKHFLPLIGMRMGANISQPTTTPTSSPTTPTTTTPPTQAPTTAPTTPPATSPVVAGGQQPAQAAELLQLINSERAKLASCPPLVAQTQLRAAAEAHSADMALRNFFSHIAPEPRTTPLDRVEATGYAGARTGENIATGQNTAAKVFDAWMASSGHKRNMLNCSYSEVGIALYYQPDDQANVQAVNDTTGARIPFGPDGFSTDPETGSKLRGPYRWYTTMVLGQPRAAR
jgi:uncharacterized protein YkwD